MEIADVEFSNGKKSVRLRADGGRAGIRQGRIFVENGRTYDGSVVGATRAGVAGADASGRERRRARRLRRCRLRSRARSGRRCAFRSPARCAIREASVEIAASGNGTVLVDFVSMMRADVRRDGMLRPDLLQALRDLAPSFIRWPGGSFASTYKWKEGIGPYVSRGYHPNVFWGGYSDYFGFGTDEFLGLVPEAERRAADRAGCAGHGARAGRVRDGLGPLSERSADDRVGTACGRRTDIPSRTACGCSRSTTSR